MAKKEAVYVLLGTTCFVNNSLSHNVLERLDHTWNERLARNADIDIRRSDANNFHEY